MLSIVSNPKTVAGPVIVLELGIVTDTMILVDPVGTIEPVERLGLGEVVSSFDSLVVGIPDIVVDAVVPGDVVAIIPESSLLGTGEIDVSVSSLSVVAVALDWLILVWSAVEAEVLLKSEQ